MKAAVCRRYGPPEQLVVEDMVPPAPGPGDALVRVHAAAVNFPDLLIMADAYQVPVPLPFVPGSELAGVVEAVGAGVAEHMIGLRGAAQVVVGVGPDQGVGERHRSEGRKQGDHRHEYAQAASHPRRNPCKAGRLRA